MEYDPLLAKLAVWAETREAAIARMIRALGEYDVSGIRTNVSFFRQILEDREFAAGHLHTGFIEEFFARHGKPKATADLEAVAALAAAIHIAARAKANGTALVQGGEASGWLRAGRDALLQ